MSSCDWVKPIPLPDMPFDDSKCITGGWVWNEMSKDDLAEEGVETLGTCSSCNEQYGCPFGGQGGDDGWKD